MSETQKEVVIYPELESTATLDQTRAIANALNERGVVTEFVENELGEPLALVARGALEMDKVVGSLSIKALTDPDDYKSKELRKVASALPIGGSTMYPASLLDIIDTAVKAATGDENMHAIDISKRSREDDSWSKAKPAGGGIGLHVDFVGNADKYYTEEPVAGLNVHVTREGEALVSLGLLRSFKGQEQLLETDTSNDQRVSLLKELGEPFTQVRLGVGDVLIFQAQQRTEKGLLPVAHDFVTTSETRLSDVFAPKALHADMVLGARKEAIDEHAHPASGYTSSHN